MKFFDDANEVELIIQSQYVKTLHKKNKTNILKIMFKFLNAIKQAEK